MRRATFETLAQWEIVLFYLLIPVTLGIFFYGVYCLARKYRQGRGQTVLDEKWRRVASGVSSILTHRDIKRRDVWAGVGHFAIFYGFLGLLIATTIVMLNDDLARPLLHVEFWQGVFYQVFKFFANLAGLALVVGTIVMMVKRLGRPSRLDYARPDGRVDAYDRRRYVIGDWAFLGALLFLGVSGFVIEAYRMAIENQSYEAWANVGWFLSRVLRALGVVGSSPAIDAFRHGLWWIHAGVALVLVASIPYTKALHMLTSPTSALVRNPSAGRRLLPIPANAGDLVGYGTLREFSSLHLVSLDACTKCGKCHVACPAASAGFPLSPRDVVLDLREAADGALGIRSSVRVPPLFDASNSVLGGVIRPEALWSCTTCMACTEICPVGIEHVLMIVQLRRRLVEEGQVDPRLQTTLQSIASSGNSFGESRRKRARWLKELPEPLKDARDGPVEYVWFVGDYGSFDPRGQAASRALAELLKQAGVDVGVLYEAEKTAGCDVRRVGEEGLWTALAEENVATLAGCSFQRIVTADPHTYHTLRTEYGQVGATWQVVHHSQLLGDLLSSRRLIPARPLSLTATYHDPCFLGRYNGIYDAPRNVLHELGVELREMPRNRDNSFCCGAGGGGIWMSEPERRPGPDGLEPRRPAEQRIEEALALGDVDTFVVACPKDLVMFSEAVKALGCENRLQVRELSELVLESLSMPATTEETGAGMN